jgi:anti-sigma regulatory factor (Ser/Thr protein kinase)
MAHLELTVPPKVEEIPKVRERVVDAVADRLDEERAEDLRLLVSEVVTNAILHGRSPAPVDVRVLAEDEVRVEIVDQGRGFDLHAPRSSHEAGGFGLKFVSQLADRWGLETDGQTRVWFCLEAA